MDQQKLMRMPKEHLVDTIAGIHKTGMDLDFPLESRQRDLESLVACFRDWTHQEGKGTETSWQKS